MAAAMLTSILVIWASIVFDPLNYSQINQVLERLTILGLSLILPIFFVIISIGRLAKFRFFSPEDIDGSGLTSGTSEAKILQSLLQNTLEQSVIAFGVYTVWCLLMPGSWLSVIPLCSILFGIGRACFFKGYSKGAPARAFGFALTFYSTAVLFFGISWLSAFFGSKLTIASTRFATFGVLGFFEFTVLSGKFRLGLHGSKRVMQALYEL